MKGLLEEIKFLLRYLVVSVKSVVIKHLLQQWRWIRKRANLVVIQVYRGPYHLSTSEYVLPYENALEKYHQLAQEGIESYLENTDKVSKDSITYLTMFSLNTGEGIARLGISRHPLVNLF